MLVMGLLLASCSIVRTKDRSTKTKVEETMFAARKGSELRKRIVVLPFINLSSYQDSQLPIDMRALYINELNKTDHVVILDIATFGITDLKEYQNGLQYDLPKLSKALKNSGVHALVVGRVKDLRTGKKGDSVGFFRRVKAEIKAEAEVSVTSVRSGKVMLELAEKSDAQESMTRFAERSYTDETLKDNPDLVRHIVSLAFEKTIVPLIKSLQKFSWEARVALVRGERVYLNAGRLSGLQIGDLLRVVDEQDEVFDPQNDRFLGYIKGRMKGTVEVISYYGKDGAVTRVHSGSGFLENDLVEFY